MQNLSPRKALLVSSLTLFTIACNSVSQKDKEAGNKRADTVVVITPSATGQPGVKNEQPVKKCYSNDGLQNNVIITMKLIGDQVVGMVTTEELESHKKETVDFEGTISKNQVAVKFKGIPPVVGKASEWTTRPWTLDTAAGKETLRIVFNAKNYETNKWAETEYEFLRTDCK